MNDDDLKLYKDLSGGSSLRCEADMISVHQNQIDDVVDFETFNNLKEFSFKVHNFEKEITNFKLIKMMKKVIKALEKVTSCGISTICSPKMRGNFTNLSDPDESSLLYVIKCIASKWKLSLF